MVRPIAFVVFLFCSFNIHAQPEKPPVPFPGGVREYPKWLNEYQPEIDLSDPDSPSNPTVYAGDGLAFKMGKNEVFSKVWGRGVEAKGIYPAETLPAMFSRKIHFDELDLKQDKLLWIFTGSKAGFTVELTRDSISLVQRFYDSFGFHDVDQAAGVRLPRYPQKQFLEASLSYKGTIHSLAITAAHNLTLKLYVNDKEVATQLSFIDVTRHQLKLSGTEGHVIGKIFRPAAIETVVKVNSHRTFQTMLGFGGLTSVVAFHELSREGKKEWWRLLKEYNLLLHREYPIGTQLKEDYSNWDNPEDATVHYYGDNFPNGEITDFEYTKRIQELGGLIIFEFFTLPPWAAKEITDADGELRQRPIVPKYVEAMINYCQTAKRKTGKPPAIVGIQNELSQPEEVWYEMTNSLRAALDANGFEDVHIHMHNASGLSSPSKEYGPGIEAAKAFSKNGVVWGKIDYATTNFYDYQNYFTEPDSYDRLISEWVDIVGDKPFLSLEISINSSKYQHDSYRLAFMMGQLYHKNLAYMNAVSLMYCWALLNGPQPTFDATRSLFRIDRQHNSRPAASSHQLRVFGAFSRRLAKGMKRVEVESQSKDLLTTAFTDGEKNAMIIVNRGVSPQQVKIDWDSIRFHNVETTDQHRENQRTNIDEIINEKNEILIEGGQILTLF